MKVSERHLGPGEAIRVEELSSSRMASHHNVKLCCFMYDKQLVKVSLEGKGGSLSYLGEVI